MPRPVVKMPSGTRLMIDLLADHPDLPPELVGKVVATLTDTFPRDLPWAKVAQTPGAGSRPVPYRVAQASFDINVYAFRDDEADDFARSIAAIAESLKGVSNGIGGVTDVTVTEPFPLPDTTTAYRWVVQVLLSYRPV